MAERPTIQPQAQRSRTTAVPTIRPEDVAVPNLTAIGVGGTAGLQEAQGAYAQMADASARFRHKLSRTIEHRRAEKEAEEKEAEALRNRELEARAVLMQNDLLAGNIAATDVMLANGLDAYAAQGLAPQETAALHKAQIDEQTKTLPPETADMVADVASIRAAPVLQEQNERMAGQARREALQATQESQDIAEAQALQYSLPDNDQQEIAGITAIQHYEQLVDLRSDLTPAEKEIEKRALRQNVQKSAALKYIASSPNPLATAIKVMRGGSGIAELDGLDSQAKMAMLSSAMQIDSAMAALQNRVDAQQESARQTSRNNSFIAIYQDPYSPVSIALSEQLLASSRDASERESAMRLREYIENEQDERFTTTDPAVMGQLQIALATNAFTPNEALEIALEGFGKGVGKDAIDAIVSYQEQAQNELIGGDAYTTLTTEAKQVFPGAFKSGTDDFMSALLGMKDPESLALAPQDEYQQELYRRMDIELRELALSGDVAGQKEYLAEGRKILQHYQNLMQARRPGTGVTALDTATLNQTEYRAYTGALKNQRAVALANNKYLENPAALTQDRDAGVINEQEYRQIYSLILPRIRAGQ